MSIGDGSTIAKGATWNAAQEPPVPLKPMVGSSGELSDFSRNVALHVYREWRDRIAAEDRRVLESLVMLLLQKRHVDGYAGRVWSATAHHYFSDLVDSVLKSMATSNDRAVGRFNERNKMNILEHPIYKDIYDLCQEIEKLPASGQETKCVVMASNLEKPAAILVGTLREIKRIVLNMTPQTEKRDLSHIIRLCIDADITQKLDELNANAPNVRRDFAGDGAPEVTKIGEKT